MSGPTSVDDPDRDRFVLSKGHAAPALYAVGAHYGFCDASAALSLRKLGSPFQGHPHVLDLPWVETSTGSLGQGFSVAHRHGDGPEAAEQARRASIPCWATANCRKAKCGKRRCAPRITSSTIFAPSSTTTSCRATIRNDAIMRLEPLAAKWRAFGWAVAEIDGHDIDADPGGVPPRRRNARAARRDHRPHRSRARACPIWKTFPPGMAA